MKTVRSVVGQNVEDDVEDAFVECVVEYTLVELVADILVELLEEILVELVENILFELVKDALFELPVEDDHVELLVKDAPAMNNARKVVIQRARKEYV